MKGAFSLFPSLGLDVVGEVEGRCAPSVSVYSRTVCQLISGSLSTCVYIQMLRRVCRSCLHIFRILLPTQDECQNLLSCSLSAMSLYFAYAYDYD